MDRVHVLREAERELVEPTDGGREIVVADLDEAPDAPVDLPDGELLPLEQRERRLPEIERDLGFGVVAATSLIPYD